ncbi:MAG: hypothetical protein ACYTXT_45245, partial [Nostoc sp.]
ALDFAKHWLESMAGIIQRTSLLNLGVRLSPHPASDILRVLPFCPCGYNRDRTHAQQSGFWVSEQLNFPLLCTMMCQPRKSKPSVVAVILVFLALTFIPRASRKSSF